MQNAICVSCGTQYPEAVEPPARCLICVDERQWVRREGQAWTSQDQLARDHRNEIVEVEPGLHRIGTQPIVAIGQHSYLVQLSGGNVMWDCVSFLDHETVAAIRQLGGLAAIAISHPHFYSSMVDWSRAFGDIPIYLHADDREWVMRSTSTIVFWEGEKHPLSDDMTLIRGGGHFSGSSMLHWSRGAAGRGVLLAADTMMVANNPEWVSFMYSFPNFLPLSPTKVRQVVGATDPYHFDRIYSAWPGRVVSGDAKAVIERSVERYLAAMRD